MNIRIQDTSTGSLLEGLYSWVFGPAHFDNIQIDGQTPARVYRYSLSRIHICYFHLFSGFRWISGIPSGEEFGLSTVVVPAKARDFL